jgi:hypothetical protein
MAVASEQPNADRVPARHQAITVVLDLVNPVRPGRRVLGGGGQARLDETSGRRTLQHSNHVGHPRPGVDSAAADFPTKV